MTELPPFLGMLPPLLAICSFCGCLITCLSFPLVLRLDVDLIVHVSVPDFTFFYSGKSIVTGNPTYKLTTLTRAEILQTHNSVMIHLEFLSLG